MSDLVYNEIMDNLYREWLRSKSGLSFDEWLRIKSDV